MGAILIIPFGQPDIKAGFVDIAQADHAGVGIADAWGTGDDHRVDEGTGDGHTHPITGHRDFAQFNVQGWSLRFGLHGDGGGAGAFGTRVVGDLQGRGKGCLGGVGMGSGLAGGRAAVAEVPRVGGNSAVAVGRAGGVKGDGQRCGPGQRGSAGHGGRGFVDRNRWRRDNDGGAGDTGQAFAVGHGQGGAVGSGGGEGMRGACARGRGAVAKTPGIGGDGGAGGSG